MRAAYCEVRWEYGSDRKVAALSIVSPTTGTTLTVTRFGFRFLSKALIRRFKALIGGVVVPEDVTDFRCRMKAPFTAEELRDFKQAHDRQAAEGAALPEGKDHEGTDPATTVPTATTEGAPHDDVHDAP